VQAYGIPRASVAVRAHRALKALSAHEFQRTLRGSGEAGRVSGADGGHARTFERRDGRCAASACMRLLALARAQAARAK